jgi:phosphoglycolate phosphatase-like HAD superfamily hydrolase
MIGDRATDMQCGRAAGTRTAWIRTGQETVVPAADTVDLESTHLPAAVEQILATVPFLQNQ